MRYATCGLLVLLLAIAPAAVRSSPSAPSQAGVIALASVDARITSKGGKPRAVKAGDAVLEGDLLASSKDGEIHVKMRDGGFLAMRPNSRVEITAYLADGGASDNATLGLISGGIRSISGWIGKFNASSYSIRTPTATIGIRGTDHETRVIPEGSSEGEAGTYDRVYAGETFIQSAAGKTTVQANQAGFQPAKARERGRLLTKIPKFYVAGPNEDEISKKHAEIQAEIAARREERRKDVLEKRSEFHDSRAKTKELVKEEEAKQGLAPTREQRTQKKEMKHALRDEKEAAAALEEDIKRKREALDADIRSGKASRQEARERKEAIAALKKELAQMQESIKQKKSAKEEAKDARIDAALEAAGDKEALKAQVGDTREKRKAFRDERQSAKEEIKSLEREEKRRYKEELKADRKNADAPK